MFWSIVISVIIVAFILWVIFDKKSPLASAIRARFHGAKAKATDLLDDANSQMDAAQAEINLKLAKANKGLIAVKTEVKSAKRDLDKNTADIEKWKNGAALANRAGQQDLAEECIVRQGEVEALLPDLQEQYNKLVDQEKIMYEAYKKLDEQQRDIKQKKKIINARGIVAKSQQDVNEILAGINSDGQSDCVARAMELVERAEDRASAIGEVPTQFKKDRDLEARLANLSQGDYINAELDRLAKESKS